MSSKATTHSELSNFLTFLLYLTYVLNRRNALSSCRTKRDTESVIDRRDMGHRGLPSLQNVIQISHRVTAEVEVFVFLSIKYVAQHVSGSTAHGKDNQSVLVQDTKSNY